VADQFNVPVEQVGVVIEPPVEMQPAPHCESTIEPAVITGSLQIPGLVVNELSSEVQVIVLSPISAPASISGKVIE